MRRNKIIKIFIKRIFGPLVFLWLCYSIYTQLLQQPHLEQSWQQIKQSVTSRKVITLFAVVLLMLANWSVEAVKWNVSMAAVYPVSFRRALYAVLSGVSLSVSLPNRMGEYAGRVLHLPQGSRLKAVPVTLTGNLSQLLVTLVCGVAGLVVLKPYLLPRAWGNSRWYFVLLACSVLVSVLLTLLYFTLPVWRTWLQRRLQHSRYGYVVHSLHAFDASLLLRLLSLSVLRYIIFSVQYVLLFSLFKVHVALYLVWSVTSVLFLAMAVIPTIALAELGIRGQVSLHLMGLFTANSLGVVLASATAWIINLILPALLGSFLILTLNFFKRNNEIL